MKKFLLLFPMLAFSLLISCSGSDSEGEDEGQSGPTTLTLTSGNTVTINPGDGSQTITFTSTESWTASVASNTDWLQVAPSQGTAEDGTITVTALHENTTDKPRSTKVSIKPLTGKTVTVTVTQNIYEEPTPDPDPDVLPRKVLTMKTTEYYNGTKDYDDLIEFIYTDKGNISKMVMSGEDEIRIAYATNSMIITITDGSDEEKMTVSLDGEGRITGYVDTYTDSADYGEERVTVKDEYKYLYENGYLSSVTSTSLHDGQWYSDDQTVFLRTGGNITEIKEIEKLSESSDYTDYSKATFTYGAYKNNINIDMTGYFLYDFDLLSVFNLGKRSPNLPVSGTRVNLDDPNESTEYTFEYETDADGYLTKATSVRERSWATIETILEFTYEDITK